MLLDVGSGFGASGVCRCYAAPKSSNLTLRALAWPKIPRISRWQTSLDCSQPIHCGIGWERQERAAATVSKGQVQTRIQLIIKIASMAAPAVVAINQLWKLLNEDGRLTEGMQGLLAALRSAATVQDPAERLRQSLAGIETYLRDQPNVPRDRSEALRERIRENQRRLDLAGTLEGTARRRVLKAVKKDTADLLKQTLTHDIQADTGGSQPSE